MNTAVYVSNELLAKAIDVSKLKDENKIIEQAIQEFIERRTRKDLSELKGKIKFFDGYDYKALREGKSVDLS